MKFALPRSKPLAKLLCLMLAVQFVAGCPARTAISAAGQVTGTAIRTTGAVVGGTVDALTFAQQRPQ